jgi:transposase InsO family protein
MAARNADLPEAAIFHSDRGSNYTSAEFAAVLESLGIRQSAGRTGSCFDNALAQCRLIKVLAFRCPHIHRRTRRDLWISA